TDAREILDLSAADRVRLMDEIAWASQALKDLRHPDKINVGALGNVVPQLHVHVLGRFKDDPAWPKPVWGHAGPVRLRPAGAPRGSRRMPRARSRPGAPPSPPMGRSCGRRDGRSAAISDAPPSPGQWRPPRTARRAMARPAAIAS